ncbi:MAG TPA: hypothetical protein VMT54_00665 [Candidatus Cybelea sp.]|nr:hypothetical protein [Candidatus Cybelea sp.]
MTSKPTKPKKSPAKRDAEPSKSRELKSEELDKVTAGVRRHDDPCAGGQMS